MIPNNQRIYAYIITSLHNFSDADDVMQETSAMMWQKFDEFRPGTDFVAWGIRIAQLKCLALKRKMRNQRLEFHPETEQAVLQMVENHHKDIDKRLKLLQRCLAKLGLRDQQFLQLRYEENMTQKKIAQRIGVTVHTVCRNFARIHDILLRCVRRNMVAEEVL
ncbi:MAG: sigma-70 family RNA polymerase sigma factor [Sedimentisphaerales bacterium]|nr:sigma-70 family RNA polymerase sigma factor [Sedimentisphaerales bacterium]